MRRIITRHSIMAKKFQDFTTDRPFHGVGGRGRMEPQSPLTWEGGRLLGEAPAFFYLETIRSTRVHRGLRRGVTALAYYCNSSRT